MKYSPYPPVERTQRLDQAWLHMLRYYLLFVAVAHLIWETLQLPLYTIWRQGSTGEIAFAVLHCTGGDLLISVATLILALLLAGASTWPERCFYPVAILTVVFGGAYTVFSEWLNIVIRKSWAYSDLMPVIPVIDTGLAPFLQWLVIPAAGLWWARASAKIKKSKVLT